MMRRLRGVLPGRLLILVVLVGVAVVLPAGAALLDRGEPATRLDPGAPPSSAPAEEPAPAVRA